VVATYFEVHGLECSFQTGGFISLDYLTVLYQLQNLNEVYWDVDRLCGLVVRVPGYRSRSPGSIPGATRFYEK
jgi:hypothetical protein